MISRQQGVRLSGADGDKWHLALIHSYMYFQSKGVFKTGRRLGLTEYAEFIKDLIEKKEAAIALWNDLKDFFATENLTCPLCSSFDRIDIYNELQEILNAHYVFHMAGICGLRDTNSHGEKLLCLACVANEDNEKEDKEPPCKRLRRN